MYEFRYWTLLKQVFPEAVSCGAICCWTGTNPNSATPLHMTAHNAPWRNRYHLMGFLQFASLVRRGVTLCHISHLRLSPVSLARVRLQRSSRIGLKWPRFTQALSNGEMHASGVQISEAWRLNRFDVSRVGSNRTLKSRSRPVLVKGRAVGDCGIQARGYGRHILTIFCLWFFTHIRLASYTQNNHFNLCISWPVFSFEDHHKLKLKHDGSSKRRSYLKGCSVHGSESQAPCIPRFWELKEIPRVGKKRGR